MVKQKITLASSQFTECNQQQILKQIQRHINSCYLLFFLHNFRLKTEVIINLRSLLLTELNK